MKEEEEEDKEPWPFNSFLLGTSSPSWLAVRAHLKFVSGEGNWGYSRLVSNTSNAKTLD
jgi:hypothetical protein